MSGSGQSLCVTLKPPDRDLQKGGGPNPGLAPPFQKSSYTFSEHRNSLKTCSVDRKSHSACVRKKSWPKSHSKKKVRAFFRKKCWASQNNWKYQPNPIENPLGEILQSDLDQQGENTKIDLSRGSDGTERATGAWTHQKWAVNNVSGICGSCGATREPKIWKIRYLNFLEISVWGL